MSVPTADDPLTPLPILGAMTNPALSFPLDLGDGVEIIYCRDEYQRVDGQLRKGKERLPAQASYAVERFN